MQTLRNACIAVLVAILLAACAGTPSAPASLVAARSEVARLDAEPRAGQFEELVQEARSELRRAERLFDERVAEERITHHAYLARQLSDLVLIQAEAGRAEEKIAAADEQRQELLLQVREREAAQARLAARRNAREAQTARAAARAARARTQELERELGELEAKQTDRGLVLTLTDVLFDTDDADLKPGAEETLDRIAQFLISEQTDKSIVVEGHTDSTGTAEYNQSLSQRRAAAVRDALVTRGVEPERIRAEGKGEAYPVATNDTAAGRQQNRRVEIIVTSGGA